MNKKRYEIIVRHYNRQWGPVPDGYQLVANVYVEASSVEEALEAAFYYTNNVNGSWSKGERLDDGSINGDYHENIIVWNAREDGWGHRSSMTGDIFYVSEEDATYECAFVGFKKKCDGLLKWTPEQAEAKRKHRLAMLRADRIVAQLRAEKEAAA